MKYIAGSIPTSDRTAFACVEASIPAVGEDEKLALRHARAMAAVVRAAKAWRRWQAKTDIKPSPAGAWDGLTRAHLRLLAAVARLEKVEREVGRG